MKQKWNIRTVPVFHMFRKWNIRTVPVFIPVFPCSILHILHSEVRE